MHQQFVHFEAVNRKLIEMLMTFGMGCGIA